jgi:hypothetical protein
VHVFSTIFFFVQTKVQLCANVGFFLPTKRNTNDPFKNFTYCIEKYKQFFLKKKMVYMGF